MTSMNSSMSESEMKKKGYTLQMDTNDNVTVCYFKNRIDTDGLWKAENPLLDSLHVLVIHLFLILFINHVLVFFLRPLRQPRIVADILAGVLLGPTAIGGHPIISKFALSFNNLLTLETVANLGLVYYMFLLGIELDFRPVIRTGKKALSIAVAGIVVSVPVGWSLHYYVLRNQKSKVLKEDEQERLWIQGPLFWGITLATTNFADLARILANLKLLHSDIGRLALSAAVISDLFSGFLFMLAMAFVSINWWSVGLTSAFIAIFVFLVRPALSWIFQCTTKKDSYNELHVCFILTWIVICGFITDACGAHSIVGAFVLGAIMPRELEIKSFLVERIGNFVSSIMMPLFYLVVGLRFNVDRILYAEKGKPNGTTEFDVMVAVALAFTAKIVGTSIAALINKITLRDSMVLGVLMNTKGLLALIILSSARDLKVLDQQMFAIMLVVVWGITVPVGPFLAFSYKSSKRSRLYKLKNIQSVGTDKDFRILACTHTLNNTSGMIELIEASNPLEQSPIHVFAVQLVELTGHASAMLIVHDACKSSKHRHEEEQSNSASNPFETYALQRENVSVQTLTVVSAYNTMHEDICTLAEDKNVNLVIIPFHKKSNIDDGTLEDSNPSFLGINKNVIENSPCSVCVFVDRGLAACRIFSNYNNDFDGSASAVRRHKIVMLFLGGTDDREALTYAWRMAGHSGIHLTVIRLTLPKTSTVDPTRLDDKDNFLEEMASTQRQNQFDDLCIDEFRLKTMNNSAIRLFEEQVSSWEEIHNILRSMEGAYALCIVGKGHGMTLSFKETSMDYDDDDYDELGALGEALVSSRFMTNTSILIIKQGAPLDERKVENKMGHVEEQFGHSIWQPAPKKTTDSVIQTDNL
ncbi:putative cation/H+ exchanger, rossmann-like alpha/beta/alpha sandwich [Rosa chinensis]|uniref:Putative cation/H+ exchanger, rossmann-like alpha/beta/alpha sandwich n=1 Tax=Rosa chinensis TaxID=74649 RepID=A0A2P6PEG8_ROSCH|nr:putative cation/H+ exchanger, rossmann-like alpha/beta/alpha sandwich [Rosa chinensis]